MMILRSFYAKLSMIFLILILALGAGSLIIAFNAAGRLFDEVEQLLNREYAASIAEELQPLVTEGFSEDGIKDEIHYMMVLNPMVEIYLVDGEGVIKSYFTHPAENLERWTIDIAPLKKFVETDGKVPVLGDDPRTSAQKKPFSAALLDMGPDAGYVYVILRGQSYDQSLEMLRSSYFLRSGFITFLFAVLATLLAGLSLFSFLTRRLRHLSSAVNAFERGEYNRRVSVKGTDELAALGRAFNEMAESIDIGVEKLKTAEQQRSDLIANISHDLRSPLTSIRGHLETILVKDYSLSDEERRDFLEISLKNVSSFQMLVEELFELAKLESKQIKPEKEPFHIAELAQDVVLKLKNRADEAGVDLAVDHPADLSAVSADIGMIERVLTNVIENALFHTPVGGKVTVSFAEKDGSLIFTITDTGGGIDAEDLPHVFERFYRGDKSRDRSTPGTGLGLAIAKEIVELHEGTIKAESPAESGAVFRVLIPLR
ncbi:MAG: HAMP domain-containing protein [Spirochaetales bacterium]|jgi:signal transduction histidine kinase|nr:HAMP domain-containing protein [Spirochaetales bacterium]